jgi:hypothetical protein
MRAQGALVEELCAPQGLGVRQHEVSVLQTHCALSRGKTV